MEYLQYKKDIRGNIILPKKVYEKYENDAYSYIGYLYVKLFIVARKNFFYNEYVLNGFFGFNDSRSAEKSKIKKAIQKVIDDFSEEKWDLLNSRKKDEFFIKMKDSFFENGEVYATVPINEFVKIMMYKKTLKESNIDYSGVSSDKILKFYLYYRSNRLNRNSYATVEETPEIFYFQYIGDYGLANSIGISKSTLNRIVSILVSLKIVKKYNTGKYSIGKSKYVYNGFVVLVDNKGFDSNGNPYNPDKEFEYGLKRIEKSLSERVKHKVKFLVQSLENEEEDLD